MRVLILQQDESLAALWRARFEAENADVSLARTGSEATLLIAQQAFDVIVLDLELGEGSALSVADAAAYRHPHTSVVFVSDTGAFSDGSIFKHAVNARALVASCTPPGDLVAMAQYYASHVIPDREAHRSPVPG